MITKEVINKNITTEERPDIDFSLMRKKGNSKTFGGWIIQRMKEARDNNKPEMFQVLNMIYQKYMEFETSEKVKIDSWKGKSSLQVFEYPDKFIVVTFQKPTPDDKAKEVKIEITKQEVNEVLVQIYILNEGKPIKTSEIAESTYKRKWKSIFSDRQTHIKLTKILELLEYKGITKYNRKGYTTILKEQQTIL